MEEYTNENPRPINPRRRKRDKMKIFKEAYLPVIIAGAALLLILIFVIGSIRRGMSSGKENKEASIAASISIENEQKRLANEAAELLVEAERFANGYDYKSAIDVIDRFSGDINNFEDLKTARAQYESLLSSMAAFEDPSQVLNLSFQLLIADPDRAFNDGTYGSAYNRNFITCEEFRQILQQMYEAGYMLVSLDDFTKTTTDSEGLTIYAPKTLYLPEGKKPLILTQTGVNYNTYMVDGDGDGFADKNGSGFASKLIVDENGSLVNEMVDKDGNTVTGAYDLVPILEAFIAEHPDFSYNGARAILAVTGYDGLFGYRTNASAKNRLGEEAYNNEVAGATTIVNALREAGYDFACYSYGNSNVGNISYNDVSSTEIQSDLSYWDTEVVPILGDTDILVFSRNDIGDDSSYSGEKFNILFSAGFRYYIGFCSTNSTWATVSNDYVRQGRIMVSGSNLAYHADWFEGMFDASAILDSSRGDIPS